LAPRAMEDQTQGPPIGQQEIERILILAPNWVGDALMSIPALACVRANFPRARLFVLAVPTVERIYRGHELVDEILVYERGGRHDGAEGKGRLIRELRRFGFGMAILFPNSFESALLACLARIPVRIGYRTDGRGGLLTHGLPRDRGTRRRHQVAYYLGIPHSQGWRGGDRRISIFIPEEEKSEVEQVLLQRGWDPGRSLIAIAPGASYGPAKKWPADRYAQVAAGLICDLRAQVVVIGSARDQREGQEVVFRLGEGAGKDAWDLTGKTTLGQLAALLSRCQLLLTNDSGAMHLAAATRTPILALFGPTDPARTSPYGVRHRILRRQVECSPCSYRSCPRDHLCMMAIEVGEVLDATADMMGSCRNKDSALAVFLDRDGTINEEVGYLSSAKDLRLIPGAVEAIRLLNQHGLKAVVVSNQSGVARGYLSETQVREINRRLEEVLGEEGAYLDGIYFCPHHPEVGEPPYRVVCDCRKPKAGMLLKAAADLGLDLCCSYVIGDHVSDVVLGKTMGLKSILLLSGHGRKEMQRISSGEAMPPDAVCTDLREAVQWVLRDLKEA